jgi:hypothetical protein
MNLLGSCPSISPYAPEYPFTTSLKRFFLFRKGRFFHGLLQEMHVMRPAMPVRPFPRLFSREFIASPFPEKKYHKMAIKEDVLRLIYHDMN